MPGFKDTQSHIALFSAYYPLVPVSSSEILTGALNAIIAVVFLFILVSFFLLFLSPSFSLSHSPPLSLDLSFYTSFTFFSLT